MAVATDADGWPVKRTSPEQVSLFCDLHVFTRLLTPTLAGEAHVVDLPQELQGEALKKGMKVLLSQLPSEWLSVYFGGQYHLPGDPKLKADVPWNDKRVRQAMNMAVNRTELWDHLFKEKGALIYVSGIAPHLEAGTRSEPKASTRSIPRWSRNGPIPVRERGELPISIC